MAVVFLIQSYFLLVILHDSASSNTTDRHLFRHAHLRYKEPDSERPGLCQGCEIFILLSNENLHSQSEKSKLLLAAILNSTIK